MWQDLHFYVFVILYIVLSTNYKMGFSKLVSSSRQSMTDPRAMFSTFPLHLYVFLSVYTFSTVVLGCARSKWLPSSLFGYASPPACKYTRGLDI